MGNTLSYSNAFKGNGVYLVVINGAVNINGVSVGRRDALGISEIDNFDITATEDAELLAIEIPMN